MGRFVPENNYETMIREFMASHTDKSFAIITTENSKYAEELQQKLQYKRDKRIKFVGTVYDAELLGKIRENAYGYLHGHEVGDLARLLIRWIVCRRKTENIWVKWQKNGSVGITAGNLSVTDIRKSLSMHE